MKIKGSVFVLAVIVLSSGVLTVGNAVGDRLTAMREQNALREELRSVIPEIGDFSVMEPTEDMPDSIKLLYVSEKGTAVRLSVTGYAAGLELLCGVKDGRVTSVVCVSSRETLGKEKTYGESFSGKAYSEVKLVNTVSGATKTTSAYKKGVLDALSAYEIVSGK